jgi:hypothetical protein
LKAIRRLLRELAVGKKESGPIASGDRRLLKKPQLDAAAYF